MESFVEFGEEVVERDGDGGVGDGEFLGWGLDEAGGGGEIGTAAERVYGPDVLDAHGGVVIDAFLEFPEGVARRKHLDAEEGWAGDDVFEGLIAPQHADVGDTVAVRAYLDALLGLDPDSPGTAVVAEDAHEKGLYEAVRTFSRGSFLHFAFEIVAIGPVRRGEVLGKRNERAGCHRGSSLGASYAPERDAWVWREKG